MKMIAFVLAISLPVAAHAQLISGRGRVIDGDTLDFTGQRIRLFGIDAPEAKQTCDRSGETWRCGEDATTLLRHIVDDVELECLQRDVDAYGRIVATCQSRSQDVGRSMIDAGLAIALPHAPQDYLDSEERRKAMKIGLWGSVFQQPAAYRAAHPQDFRAPTDRSRSMEANVSRPQWRANPAPQSFRSCAEAWAAGAAPLYRGQPGYRPEMDGDGDGVACEPYRGRR